MIILSNKFSDIILKESGIKSLQKIVDAFIWFKDLLDQNKLFNFVTNSPSVSVKQKIALIEKISSHCKIKIPEIAINTLIILVKLQKTKILKDIILNLEHKIYKDKGITLTDIYFATKPTEKQIKTVDDILVKLCKIDPEKNIKIDTSVVAGFIAYFDGKRLDASLHNAFEEFAKLHIE
jgi:ATP synthase F1 delta subunit